MNCTSREPAWLTITRGWPSCPCRQRVRLQHSCMRPATRSTEATMMFLDCPAHLDQDGAVRCGLPADARDGTDGVRRPPGVFKEGCI